MRASEFARSLALLLCLWTRMGLGADATLPTNQSRALARAQVLLKEMAEERDALKARAAELEERNAAFIAKVAQLEQARDAATAAERAAHGSLADLNASKVQCEREIDAQAKAADVLRAELAQAGEAQNASVESKTRLEKQLLDARQRLDETTAHNQALYRTGQEILARYRLKHGVRDVYLREPLTGLPAVGTENEIEALDAELYHDLGAAPAQGAAP